MSSTPAVKAVSNGTTTDTTKDTGVKSAPVLEGIAYVRQQQVYHVTGLAHAALYEAEHLVRNINTAASISRQDRDALDLAKAGHVLSEALDCIDIATEHLAALNIQLRSFHGEDASEA